MSRPQVGFGSPKPMPKGRSKLDLNALASDLPGSPGSPSWSPRQLTATAPAEASRPPTAPAAVPSRDSEHSEQSQPRQPLTFIPSVSATDHTRHTVDQRPNVLHLTRGGVRIETKIGWIQVGAPPETVKDSISLVMEPPNVLVMPEIMFDIRAGINVSEVEFPAYFNFFVLRRKIVLVCTTGQARRVERVFQETALGPREFDIVSEYCGEFPPDCIPHLRDEMDYFKKGAFQSVNDMFDFVCFDENNVATLPGGVAIRFDPEQSMFHFSEDHKITASVPSIVDMVSHPLARRPSAAVTTVFKPPKFGVTIIGASHGFDHTSSTTGFVVWVNGRGIVVDPPLNTAALLHASGIPSRLVDSVILTHCHADHDAGVMQKLLEEKQLQLFTTKTIMESFVRKYSAILADEGTKVDIRSMFTFRPVVMGAATRIKGAEFKFHYTVHSIPTIGFEVYLLGKSLFYSCDTCNIPEVFDRMYEEKRMPLGRYEFWKNPSWHHCALILHEAGVPPIHTPAKELAKLPADVKKRMYLVHVAEKDIPVGEGLRVAPVGVENTLVILGNDETGSMQEAIEVLDVLEESGILHMMSAAQAKEVLQVAKKFTFKAGDNVFKEGDPGEFVYVIVSGVIRLFINSQYKQAGDSICFTKECICGDFFGEMALISNNPRNATATAVAESTLVGFQWNDFLSLCRGDTKALARLRHLVEIRSHGSYQAMMMNGILSDLSGQQKTELQYIMKKMEATAGETVWTVGEPADSVILVASGQFSVETCGLELMKDQEGAEGHTDMNNGLTRKGSVRGSLSVYANQPKVYMCENGSLLGHMGNVIARTGRRVTTVMCTNTPNGLSTATYFKIEREDLIRFFSKNPGVKMVCLAAGNNLADA